MMNSDGYMAKPLFLLGTAERSVVIFARPTRGNSGKLPQGLGTRGTPPPEDSATIGMKVTPRWLHSASALR